MIPQTAPKPEADDTLFSPEPDSEPAGEQLVGQRGADSVLFSLQDLAQKEQVAPTKHQLPRLAASAEPATGSGLIDLQQLLSSTEPKGPPPAAQSSSTLLAQSTLAAETNLARQAAAATETGAEPVAPRSRAPTIFLVIGLMTIAAAVAAIVFKAG